MRLRWLLATILGTLKICLIGLLCFLAPTPDFCERSFGAFAQPTIHIAAQGPLIQYAPSIQKLVEAAGYHADSTPFLSDENMVEEILNYNLSISGGPLFQCMQLATHSTKAMNLIVTIDPQDATPIQYSAGAIVALESRHDINSLSDLKGKSIAAGQPTQIATFLSQWFVLRQANINLFADVGRINIIQNSSALIPMLMSGDIDVIFVSALQMYGRFLQGLKVINEEVADNSFPYPRSTSLYAGPLVSAVGDLNFIFRKDISIKLLESAPNTTVQLYGFTTPGDYSTVRNLMDGLGVIGPDFLCRYAQDVQQLIMCPAGFHQNDDPYCSTCPPNATCICKACTQVHKLSTVSIISIAFSLGIFATALIAVAVVYRIVKKRQTLQKMDALSAEAQDVFGHESAIRVIDWLGSGSSAEVYRGYWYNQEVAFKVGRNQRTSLEGELTTRLHHPNIVTTHACGQSTYVDGPVWLITEFCSLGNLSKAIVGKLFDVDSDLGKILHVLKQLAKALHYVHSLKLVHGDLNGNNVLLTRAAGDHSRLIVKLADFEHARYSGSYTDSMGTLSHLAPECFKSCDRRASQDIYAFAIIMWEMCHRAIYQVQSSDIFSVMAGTRPVIAANVPQQLAGLMQQGWAEAPDARPNTDEVLARLDELALHGVH